jgi:hypothetical protein
LRPLNGAFFMEYISKNDELLKQGIPGGYFVLDAEITRFDVNYQNYQLNIDVYLSLPFNRFKAEKNLKLHFIGVTAYDFNWNDKYNFYTVERYKFLKTGQGIILVLNLMTSPGKF